MKGVEGMIKKFTTSISKPPLTIFFMKDSWFKVIFYVLFITFLVVIPAFIKIAIDPTMDYQRYQNMQNKLKTDFVIENAHIVDGVLTYESVKKINFEFYEVYLGTQNLASNKVNFVFEESHLVVYVTGIEMDRLDYVRLNLEEFDFSSTDGADLTRLSVALKTMYERQDFLFVAEVFAQYFIIIADYIFVALLMAVLMAVFVNRIPMPFSMRFKLSIYLSSIYAAIQLILVLFGASYLNIFGMMAVYFYHVWAYRTIKIIPKGVI